MSMQFVSPLSGTCISEFIRNNGQHSIIVYDDLSKHAVSYRQLSLFCVNLQVERHILVMFLFACQVIGTFVLFELYTRKWYFVMSTCNRNSK